jgi:hypothetical protein
MPVIGIGDRRCVCPQTQDKASAGQLVQSVAAAEKTSGAAIAGCHVFTSKWIYFSALPTRPKRAI